MIIPQVAILINLFKEHNKFEAVNPAANTVEGSVILYGGELSKHPFISLTITVYEPALKLLK